MTRLLLGALCALAAGALLGIPTGLTINAGFSPMWGVPIALLMVVGMGFTAWMFQP